MPTRAIYDAASGALLRVIVTDTDAEMLPHQPQDGEAAIDVADADYATMDAPALLADVETATGLVATPLDATPTLAEAADETQYTADYNAAVVALGPDATNTQLIDYIQQQEADRASLTVAL